MRNRIVQIVEIFAWVFILLITPSNVFAQNGWSQKADIPGPGRNHMVMFGIGNAGYTLTGG